MPTSSRSWTGSGRRRARRLSGRRIAIGRNRRNRNRESFAELERGLGRRKKRGAFAPRATSSPLIRQFSQFSAPPVWYSVTLVSKKFFSFFRSIISAIHGNGF